MFRVRALGVEGFQVPNFQIFADFLDFGLSGCRAVRSTGSTAFGVCAYCHCRDADDAN